MEKLGSVQQKISCVFEIAVLDEQSTKRENQPYKVVATQRIKQKALDNGVESAVATEKLDGTCVYFGEFQGKPWMWARFDRKPTKGAEKRFRKFQQQQQKQQQGDGPSNPASFKWDNVKDFKETPAHWIPASGVNIVCGSPIADDIGHTPGWVPVLETARQHVWHLSALDLTAGLALVLCEEANGSSLYIDCVPLCKLQGHTAELIGTNINANPYGLGSKKYPIHLLVVHGSIPVREAPGVDSDSVREWMMHSGQVEGIVWHCSNGTLFKVHRNHVGLAWPVAEPSLSQKAVRISMETASCDLDTNNTLISHFISTRGQSCQSVKHLERLLSGVDGEKLISDCDHDGESKTSTSPVCS